MNGQAPARAFGLITCLALVMGNMIGSGVYLLPAALAPFGWTAVAGWLVTIGGCLSLAWLFAVLARALPEAGGLYVYTREAFGKPAGFAVAWAYWVSVWVANAAIAVAAVSYLSLFAPAIASVPAVAAILALGIIWTLTTINCLSVRLAGGFQVATVALKLLPILGAVLIAAVLLASDQAQVPPSAVPREALSLSAVATVSALTFWAMQGFETATIPAERVRDPSRVIPLATLYGTLATGLLYLCACTAVTMMLPYPQSAASNAPFADFFGRFVSPEVGMVIAAFAAISAIGALNGWTLIQGELPLALARDGNFPAWFARTGARGTPVRAQLVASSLVSLLVLSNYTRSIQDLFLFMALLATVAGLFIYLLCVPAAIVLMRRGVLPRSRRTLVAAVLGFAFALWALFGAGIEAVLWGLALVGAGLPLWLGMRRFSLSGSIPAAAAPAAAPPGPDA